MSAQRRYPSEVKIEKARIGLREHLQSLRANGLGHLVEYPRSQNQIQTRDSFANAWKQLDPEIIHFLGSWRDYESIWNIYPSATKGQVCIIRRSSDYASFDLGEVKNGKIYTQSGQVIFPEDKYLGVLSAKTESINEVPLHSPMPLKDPSSFEYIDNSFNPTQVIRSYEQAGCTYSLLSSTTTSNLTNIFFENK